MLTCPMCKKAVQKPVKECPTCRADLGILVDYYAHLEDGLVRAEELTRKGLLGEAVWAYLEVLEVDPDHPVAKRQVSRVVTAVRQFDEHSPGRQWVERLRRRASFRRWMEDLQDMSPRGWRTFAVLFILLFVLFGVGFYFGYDTGKSSLDEVPTQGFQLPEAPADPSAIKNKAKDSAKDTGKSLLDKLKPTKDTKGQGLGGK